MPSAAEQHEIRNAIAASRAGGASLDQLLRAHTLAQEARLPHVTAELRNAIRKHIPDPEEKKIIIRSITLGVVSGIFTHFLLKTFRRKRVTR